MLHLPPEQLVQKSLGHIKEAYTILSQLMCIFIKNKHGMYWDKENNELTLVEKPETQRLSQSARSYVQSDMETTG